MKQFEQFVEMIRVSKPKIRGKAQGVLHQLNDDKIALIAVITLQRSLVEDWTAQRTCCHIGRILTRGIDERTIHVNENKTIDSSLFQIGYYVIYQLIKADKLDLIVPRDKKLDVNLFNELYPKKGSRWGKSKMLEVLDAEWIGELLKQVPIQDELNPALLPYVYDVPEWYSFNHPELGDLVRKCNRSVKRRFNTRLTPVVFDNINKLQAQRYRVNTEVLDIVLASIKSMDALLTFSRKKISEKRKVSKIFQRDRIVSIARDYAEYESIGFAMNYGFRGRLYYQTQFFNPGGEKLAKGLIVSADSKIIGIEGWNWLLYHAANTWGEDKLPIDDRILFAMNKLEVWMEIAKDPYSNKLWQEADDPYNFLAVILDLKKAIDSGDRYSHKSSVLIGFDASNSGGQFLGGVAKDPDTCGHCNLSNSSERGDSYSAVGEHTSVFPSFTYTDKEEVLHKRIISDMGAITNNANLLIYLKKHRKAIESVSHVLFAKVIALDPKQARKLAKRPVMTRSYTAGVKSIASALWDDFEGEPGYEGLTPIHCKFLAKKMYDAYTVVLPGCEMMMKGFQYLGNEQREKGNDVEVVSMNTGFITKQDYYLKDSEVVKVVYFKSLNGFKEFRLTKKSKYMDIGKILSSTPPNITHSWDADYLGLVVKDWDKWITINHDAFYFLAADAGEAFEYLRIKLAEWFNQSHLESIAIQNDVTIEDMGITIGTHNTDELLDNDYALA